MGAAAEVKTRSATPSWFLGRLKHSCRSVKTLDGEMLGGDIDVVDKGKHSRQ